MKALTANDLRTGDTVFWSQGAWVEQFADAEIFEGEGADVALAQAEKQITLVVSPYLIDVHETPEGLAPVGQGGAGRGARGQGGADAGDHMAGDAGGAAEVHVPRGRFEGAQGVQRGQPSAIHSFPKRPGRTSACAKVAPWGSISRRPPPYRPFRRWTTGGADPAVRPVFVCSLGFRGPKPQ